MIWSPAAKDMLLKGTANRKPSTGPWFQPALRNP